MEKSELIATLQKLHTELSQTDQADPETVNRLHVLTGEIQQLLERSETPPEDAGTTTPPRTATEVRSRTPAILRVVGANCRRLVPHGHLTQEALPEGWTSSVDGTVDSCGYFWR